MYMNQLTTQLHLQTQAEEWDDTIPRISFVLDPSERKLEEDILRKPLISKPLYNKRMFVIEKLRDIALHVPNATLILSAQNLLDDFDTHHHKHADIVSFFFTFSLLGITDWSSSNTLANDCILTLSYYRRLFYY